MAQHVAGPDSLCLMSRTLKVEGVFSDRPLTSTVPLMHVQHTATQINVILFLQCLIALSYCPAR